MRHKDMLRLPAGAMLFAILAYALLAVPGLVSDSASAGPGPAREARR